MTTDLPAIINTPEFAGAVLIKYASAPIECMTADEYQTASEGIARGMIEYFKKDAGLSDDQACDAILQLVAIGLGASAGIGKQASVGSTLDGWRDKVLGGPGGVAGWGKRQAGSIVNKGIEFVKSTDAGQAWAREIGDQQREKMWQEAPGKIWDMAKGWVSDAGKWISNPDNIKTWAPYAIGGLGALGAAKVMGAGNGMALAAGAAGAIAAPHLVKGFQAWNSQKPNVALNAAPATEDATKKSLPQQDPNQQKFDSGHAAAAQASAQMNIDGRRPLIL